MRKYLLIVFLAGLISCTTTREFVPGVPFSDGDQYIILMHPTVTNLQIFQYLTENNIFVLPDNYKAVGVYHKSAAYDYSQSYDYIRKKRADHISLLGLEPGLDETELFRENQLTSQFRYIFDRSQGIIFFGGPDIPPSIYGQPLNLLTVITDPHRHYLELSYLYHLLGGFQDEDYKGWMQDKPDYRILGLCLGMQTMNVATGGTMIQDIPTEIYGFTTVEQVLSQPQNIQHRNYLTHMALDRSLESDSYHQISILPNSLMHRIAGETTPIVLSSHHQALKELGKGWKITAWCMEGVVPEAIEHEVYPHVMGVQFHPERIKIFNHQQLKKEPGKSTGKSFSSHFPGELGEDFHYEFWRILGQQYFVPKGKE